MKAKRRKSVIKEVDIEIIKYSPSTSFLDADGTGCLWIKLKRRCCVCNELFKHGDSVGLCMYMEDGNQRSGGVHAECVAGQVSADLWQRVGERE